MKALTYIEHGKFDSYDRMHENRYFRWYFIRKGNSISQLFTADDRNKIYITQNVQKRGGLGLESHAGYRFLSVTGKEITHHYPKLNQKAAGFMLKACCFCFVPTVRIAAYLCAIRIDSWCSH